MPDDRGGDSRFPVTGDDSDSGMQKDPQELMPRWKVVRELMKVGMSEKDLDELVKRNAIDFTDFPMPGNQRGYRRSYVERIKADWVSGELPDLLNPAPGRGGLQDTQMGVRGDIRDTLTPGQQDYVVWRERRIRLKYSILAIGAGAGALAIGVTLGNISGFGDGMEKVEEREKAAFEMGGGMFAKYNKLVRENPSQAYITGHNSREGGDWVVGVNMAKYLDLRATEQDVKDPEEYVDIVVDVDNTVGAASRLITDGASNDYEKAQMIFDYMRGSDNLFFGRSTEKRTLESGNTVHVRHPLETLVDGGGENEDFAVLSAAMLKQAGFETALFYFTKEGQRPFLAAGVALDMSDAPKMRRTCYPVGGKKFYLFMPGEQDASGKMQYVGHAPSWIKGRKAQVFPVR